MVRPIRNIFLIRQHDDGGILHRQVAHDAAGVERHRQALARPLGVPDHADPPVAAGAGRLAARLVAAGPVALGDRLLERCRAQRLGDGGLHRVELVVPGHLLDQGAAAVVLEHDEVANQRQQPAPVEDAFEQHLELRQLRVGQRLARDRAPGLEPLRTGRQRVDTRLQFVRHDERAGRAPCADVSSSTTITVSRRAPRWAYPGPWPPRPARGPRSSR